MNVAKVKLRQLVSDKLVSSGLKREHADVMANVIVFAESRGFHSHGCVRVEYYCERISKGGITVNPRFEFEKSGPCTAILHGDNGPGMVVAKLGMENAIQMAKDKGVAVVGMKNMSHSGAISYYTYMAAQAGLLALSVCHSEPLVVPFGGSEIYYGTNPIAYSIPGDGNIITFDMATTVQAWGKILDAQIKGEAISEGVAVDKDGKMTTDPFAVKALLPVGGPKGYGLMLLVDVLSAVLLGLPFGKHVKSMYSELNKGRNLGQLHIVINPASFGDPKIFTASIAQVIRELHAVAPAQGVERVLYPGENADLEEKRTEKEGIDVVDDIYRYLISDKIYVRSYERKDKFN